MKNIITYISLILFVLVIFLAIMGVHYTQTEANFKCDGQIIVRRGVIDEYFCYIGEGNLSDEIFDAIR